MAKFTKALWCVWFTWLVSAQRLDTQQLNVERFWKDDDFHFRNCNRSVVPLDVISMEVTSDPIRLDKPFLIFMDFSLNREIGENHNSIQVQLNLKLKTEKGYTELCEFIGEKFCYVDDLCELLRYYTKGKCPTSFWKEYHNNCSCPFTAREYHIPIPIPRQRMPFELRGTFDVTITLQEQGRYLGCINLQFCISKCKPLPSEQRSFLDWISRSSKGKTLHHLLKTVH